MPTPRDARILDEIDRAVRKTFILVNFLTQKDFGNIKNSAFSIH